MGVLRLLPWILMGVFALSIAGGTAALWVLVPPDPTFGGAEVSMADSPPIAEAESTAQTYMPEPVVTQPSGTAPSFADQAVAPSFAGGDAAPSFASPGSLSATPPPPLPNDTPLDGDTDPSASEAPTLAAADTQSQEATTIDPTTGGLTSVRDIEASTALGNLDAKGALKPAPDDDLVQSTAQGPLPIVSEDGEKQAWSTYARPFRDTTLRPRVSLLLVGLGNNAQHTTTALQTLPSEVSVAFRPYIRNVDYWAQQSRQVGHEVFVEVPLEPFDYPTNDPGPKALLTTLSPEENINRLEWTMSRFPGYVGLVNFMGGRFNSSERHIADLLTKLKRHGLSFVEQDPAQFSQAATVASKILVPFKQSDLVVDVDPGQEAILARLKILEETAQKGRAALGIIRPYPSTLRVVDEWVKTLPEKNMVLAPVSAVLSQRGSS